MSQAGVRPHSFMQRIGPGSYESETSPKNIPFVMAKSPRFTMTNAEKLAYYRPSVQIQSPEERKRVAERIRKYNKSIASNLPANKLRRSLEKKATTLSRANKTKQTRLQMEAEKKRVLETSYNEKFKRYLLRRDLATLQKVQRTWVSLITIVGIAHNLRERFKLSKN